MRNFGAVIENLRVGFCDYPEEYHTEIIDLLVRYCSEKLAELCLWELNITYPIARKMQPMLRSLRKLELYGCEFCNNFLKMLPKWAPNIEKLTLRGDEEKSGRFKWTSLFQNFPKMENIVIDDLIVTNADIEGIVSHNPQLKKLKLLSRKRIDGRILQFIAEHLPRIEKLHLKNAVTTEKTNVRYLSQLRNLESLHIIRGKLEVWEIDFENLPLEYLGLEGIDFGANADRLIVEISKLKKLKHLEMESNRGLTASHIIDICKQHSELTELTLVENTNIVLDVDDLWNILQNAEKLEKLYYAHHAQRRMGGINKMFYIDVDAFNVLLNIIQMRCHKVHLEIFSNLYDELEIPRELMKLHEKKIEITMYT